MSTVLLAAKLLELRKTYGISQKEIADYLGITREAYSHYERNTREPSLETIIKLTKFYNIDVSELINESTVLISLNAQKKNEKEKSDKITSNTASAIPNSTASNIITRNIQHFLKLFSGKNSNLDVTCISKDDINFLAEYKKLNKQNQNEIKQYVKFKSSINEKKE